MAALNFHLFSTLQSSSCTKYGGDPHFPSKHPRGCDTAFESSFLPLFVLWYEKKNKGGNGMAEQLMETTWRTALWRQFGAAIDMLENALLACPAPLWKERLCS